MRDTLRLEALEVLDAIDRHGSFAAAAAALYRVPSAISYTVNQLETEVGVQVFDRSGHRARLTPAGRLLLEEGRRILAATSELSAAAKRLANNWEPELRIALNGLVPPALLWPTIDRFTAEHPSINLHLQEEVLTGSWEALVDQRAELAVGVTEMPAITGIEREPFIDIDFVFCCAPNHPLAQAHTPLDEAQLRAHRGIIVADSARSFPRRNAAGLLDSRHWLTVANMQSKVTALEAGLGVGYCPRLWVREMLAEGRLAAPPLAEQRPPVTTWLVWRSGESGRGVKWFVDALRQW
ncbi:LysR substrate-binding domain-containing protein [Kushneria aurantia]|uniref:LysR substrate-binding domain-containing protein n=1 Tax=Kushneria aurantia TaxID=504092 RepID=A0ABV6G2G9_9GAMM|nr:LysR substrate-binding domain-containing protein [Kushneria aurantia]